MLKWFKEKLQHTVVNSLKKETKNEMGNQGRHRLLFLLFFVICLPDMRDRHRELPFSGYLPFSSLYHKDLIIYGDHTGSAQGFLDRLQRKELFQKEKIVFSTYLFKYVWANVKMASLLLTTNVIALCFNFIE